MSLALKPFASHFYMFYTKCQLWSAVQVYCQAQENESPIDLALSGVKQNQRCCLGQCVFENRLKDRKERCTARGGFSNGSQVRVLLQGQPAILTEDFLG